MKTVEEMQAAGMSQEDIEKALKEQGLTDGDLAKALEDLEALTKSEGEDIDALIKAIEEQEAALAKSDDDDDDDKCCGDDEGDGEDEDDEGDDAKKSINDNLEMQELVKASEAYAQLEESVHKSMGNLELRILSLQKSQLATMNLLIKTAKAIADMQEGMQKSIDDAAAARPVPHNPGFLGKGKEGGGESLKKSKSEVHGLLLKAAQEGRVDAKYLSVLAVRGVEALPEFVAKELGL